MQAPESPLMPESHDAVAVLPPFVALHEIIRAAMCELSCGLRVIARFVGRLEAITRLAFG
jgi:hypothetical protein